MLVVGLILILATIAVSPYVKYGPRTLPAVDWPIAATQMEPDHSPKPKPDPKPKPEPFPIPKPQQTDEIDSEALLVVHRIGGRFNLALTDVEKKLDPPGFSVLIGGTPQQAALQIRTAFPNATRLHEQSKVVATAQLASIRAIGFDVLPWPTVRLPNHGRLIHQSRRADAFENPVQLSLLSGVMVDTPVP
jgi:hypothetical protein